MLLVPTYIGIIHSTFSEEWKKQRNVALQILRSLGYGKHSIENKICEEAQALCNVLQKQTGQNTDPEDLLDTSVANVICSLLYGQRYKHGDAEFKHVIKVFIQNDIYGLIS